VSDGDTLTVVKDQGLVASVFDDRTLAGLTGHLAIGHCRYSTTGSSTWRNAQPAYRSVGEHMFALGHNGNLVNTEKLAADAGMLEGTVTSDSDLVAELIAAELSIDAAAEQLADLGAPVTPADDGPHGRLERAVATVVPRLEGAYSFVIMDESRVIGVRDPHGFRPLVLGRLPRPDRPGGATDAPGPGLFDDAAAPGWCLSSETASLDIVGAEYVRDVEPGEIVVLEAGQPPRSVRYAAADPTLCVFELIYFARPDSYMEGRNLYEVRRRMGEQLAWEHPVDADLVMPVPDTGAPAAAGYAEASGLPYREGMYRNRYAGRTFIQPSQGMRHRGVTIKLNPLREVVAGKRLVVVDDSIVRGTTTKRIVELLRKAGAREVHVRISAPPIFHPSFYGIDTSIETELIASTHSEPEIRDFIGADSLGYLSIRGVLAALDLPYERFCFACFDGNYPEPVPYDTASRKFVLEEAVGAGRG
jgi:amidophosphoribosyltransferase